jgi:hypothetical protein
MSLRKQLIYAGRHFTPTWRYLFNLKSTFGYRREPMRLDGESLRIVNRLNRDGIAICSTELLPGVAAGFDELERAVEQLEDEWAGRIAAARQRADGGDVGRKTFILQLLGERPRLEPESVFARFALQPQILAIANAYFGMYTQLRYYNVWHTLTTRSQPRESQLWHYDREDHLILKLFVYLSDVDEGAGPFTYAPGTHRKGRRRREPHSFDEQGVRRWNDQQMSEVIPAANWIQAIGPKGSIVFADTRGFHKGGLVRERDRLLFTCLFTSPTSQAPELFERPQQLSLPPSVNKAQTLALATPAKGLWA